MYFSGLFFSICVHVISISNEDEAIFFLVQ